MVNRTTDAIIVGAGPAGLSAAIYLARYDRTVVVFDAGLSAVHDLVLADMDGDGTMELVTGSFHAYPPHERLARLTLWQR